MEILLFLLVRCAIATFDGSLGRQRDRRPGTRRGGIWENRVWTALPSIDSTKDARVYACCIVK